MRAAVTVSAALQAWKDAEETARQQEARLATAWGAYDSRTGGVPSAELMTDVSRLRAIASERLATLLQLMQAEQRHHESSSRK